MAELIDKSSYRLDMRALTITALQCIIGSAKHHGTT